MNERVLIEKYDSIAVVTLNRPDKHNGLDEAMMLALLNAAKQLRRDRDSRCVILKGDGASFCAGLDFASVTKRPSTVLRFFIKWPWSLDNRFQRVAYCWRTLPMPVIAAIHGSCFGGGLQMALGCDYRIASPDAKLSVMEIKWGLVPDMSAMVTLPQVVRMDIAKELTMTGRIVSASEAAKIGLVSRINDDPLSAAFALAERIAERSPDAVAATKYLFDKTWTLLPRWALFWERGTQLRLLGRRNQRIAMKNALKPKEPSTSFTQRRF